MNKHSGSILRVVVNHMTSGLLVSAVALSSPAWPAPARTQDMIATAGRVPARCGGLASTASLWAGHSIHSCKNGYKLIMQNDGNLVLYSAGAQPLWSSLTDGKGGAVAVMRDDGNLVVYTASGRDSHHAVWMSNTHHPGARLTIHDDGNLVIHIRDKPLWETSTGRSESGNVLVGNDYPAAWKQPGRDAFANISGLNRECVSFASWKIYVNTGGKQVPTGVNVPSDWLIHSINVDADWGSAYNWSAYAAGHGVRMDNNPTPGSIAQWIKHPEIGMTVGHVGVVKSVYPDGSIDIEQYNLRENGLYSVLHMRKNSPEVDRSNGRGPWTVPWPDHFIHVHGR